MTGKVTFQPEDNSTLHIPDSTTLSDEDDARDGCFVIYADGATSDDCGDLWSAAIHAADVVATGSVIRFGSLQHLHKRTLAEKLFRKFLGMGRIDLRNLTLESL